MKLDLKVRNNVAYLALSTGGSIGTLEVAKHIRKSMDELAKKLEPHYDDVITIVNDEVNLFGEVSE